jgi:serine/threonine-protein kinase
MSSPTDDPPEGGEAKSQAPRSLIGEVISGRYRVTQLLATGGVSAVYLGQHVHMLKNVAIKVLDPSAEKLPEFVARFRREAVAGAHVQHPHIASAIDFGQLDDGSYFLVQEYVPGMTLNRVIANGKMDPVRAVAIARRMASALQAAHDVGIVHRDVKPSNVMLVEGTEDVVKLIDFGFAKLRFSDVPTLAPPPDEPIAPEKMLTQAGVVLGTVAYMAPEAALGMASVDQRSDLYALGLILYELLSGLHPFDATEPVRLFLQQRTEIPPPISKRAPGTVVPIELENVVKKLLEKDPKDRYASANDVIAALDGAMLSKGFETVPEVHAAERVSAPSREANVLTASPRDSQAEARPPRECRDDVEHAARAIAPVTADASRESAGNQVASENVALGAAHEGTDDAWGERLARLPGVASILAALPVNGRFPRWAYLAFPAMGIAFLLLVVVLLRARSSEATEGNVSDALATGEMGEAPPATSAREVTMEVAGLDASGWRMNLRNAARKKEWAGASEAVLTLMRLDPSAFRDHDVQGALRSSAVGLEEQGGEAADKFWAALSQGAEGLDLVYDVARNRPGTKAGKRATEILRRPEVMTLGSPALKVLFDYREASCVGRRDLFARMAEQGDERALSELVQTRDADCGRRDPCCYKENRALGTSIRSLKTRLAAAPPTPPQAP